MGDDDRHHRQHDRRRPVPQRLLRRRFALGQRHHRQQQQRQGQRLVGELGAPVEEVEVAGVDRDPEAGDAGGAADPLEEQEEGGDEDQAGGADQDQAGGVGGDPGQLHQRRGGSLQARVVGRRVEDRVVAEEVVVVGDLVGVEGVDQLVGEGEERGVAEDLDQVQREAQHADQGQAFAGGGVRGGEPVEDRQRDQQDPGPVEGHRRRQRRPRERVGDGAEQEADAGREDERRQVADPGRGRQRRILAGLRIGTGRRLGARQTAEAVASASWVSALSCGRCSWWMLRRRRDSLRIVPSTRKPSRKVLRLLSP